MYVCNRFADERVGAPSAAAGVRSRPRDFRVCVRMRARTRYRLQGNVVGLSGGGLGEKLQYGVGDTGDSSHLGNATSQQFSILLEKSIVILD